MERIDQHVDSRIERIRKIRVKRRNKKLLFIVQISILAILWYANQQLTPYTATITEGNTGKVEVIEEY